MTALIAGKISTGMISFLPLLVWPQQVTFAVQIFHPTQKLPIFTQPHHFSHFHSTPKPTNFHSTPPGKIFYLIKKAYKFQSPLESFPFSLFLSFSPSPCIICTQLLHLFHLNPAKTVPQGNIDILKEWSKNAISIFWTVFSLGCFFWPATGPGADQPGRRKVSNLIVTFTYHYIHVSSLC